MGSHETLVPTAAVAVAAHERKSQEDGSRRHQLHQAARETRHEKALCMPIERSSEVSQSNSSEGRERERKRERKNGSQSTRAFHPNHNTGSHVASAAADAECMHAGDIHESLADRHLRRRRNHS